MLARIPSAWPANAVFTSEVLVFDAAFLDSTVLRGEDGTFSFDLLAEELNAVALVLGTEAALTLLWLEWVCAAQDLGAVLLLVPATSIATEHLAYS